MRVGIDGKCLLPPRAGVARYLEGVLAGVRTLAPRDIELEVLTPTAPRRTMPWVLWDLQRASARGFDVLHFPFYYVPLAPRCPSTVAIHDVLVLQHPEWFPRSWANPIRLLLPRGARRAAAIVTGSPSVADEIASRCGVAREKVRVIPYGLNPRLFAPPELEAAQATCARRALHAPFLLKVGALEARRGVDLAVAATARLRRSWPELELALVGDAHAAIPELAAEPPWVRRLGRVDDAELPALYTLASAVLAPSRGEGFDLPVLEALACGALVVASDIPVHREYFAPAVELFASGDADALAAACVRVLDDSGHAAALRARAVELAAAFTWEDSARRHLELWREVAAR